MNEPEDPTPEAIPAPIVHRRRGLSIVWLVPLIALALGGWLGYRTLTEQGPEITITFNAADGLEAGRTKVKYKNVEVGQVERIDISDDLDHVVVTARLVPDAEPHLLASTRFWVVRPRIGVDGISGLGTLVSGAFIEVEPGAGPPARKFKGLEAAPISSMSVPGLKLVLRAPELGSLNVGSPILYREIPVGEIEGHRLSDDRSSVLVDALIEEPYAGLIREGTRFWNASGIDLSLDAGGLSLTTESIEALLIGGVAFETPGGPDAGEAVASGAMFDLYDRHSDVATADFTEHLDYVLHFEGSVRGLEPGAPVSFHGVRVGTVRDLELRYDVDQGELTVPVYIGIEPGRIPNAEGTKRRSTRDDDPSVTHAEIETLIGRGLRARLESGSLLTGAKFVSLGFYPESPPQWVDTSDQYPEIPTVPSQIDALFDRVQRLPIEELLVGFTGVARSVNNALSKAEETMDGIEGAIGEESKLNVTLSQTLDEVRTAARSIRVLADLLERQPNSVVFGKEGS